VFKVLGISINGTFANVVWGKKTHPLFKQMLRLKGHHFHSQRKSHFHFRFRGLDCTLMKISPKRNMDPNLNSKVEQVRMRVIDCKGPCASTLKISKLTMNIKFVHI